MTQTQTGYQISRALWEIKKKHGYASVTAEGKRAILQYNPLTGGTELHIVWVTGLSDPKPPRDT